MQQLKALLDALLGRIPEDCFVAILVKKLVLRGALGTEEATTSGCFECTSGDEIAIAVRKKSKCNCGSSNFEGIAFARKRCPFIRRPQKPLMIRTKPAIAVDPDRQP
jgi:hypothetical protein